MTIVSAIEALFYSALGVLVLLLVSILWKIRASVTKGDFEAVYWGIQGIPFLTKKGQDIILQRTLENHDARELERLRNQRRDVVELLGKIPGLEVTKTGLEEGESPSRR